MSSSGYEITRKVTEGVNLQNIPAEDEFRSCFIADPGCMLLTLDYSGQEVCIAAKQSRDPLLIASIMNGLDIHSKLATDSFRIIRQDDTIVVSKKHNIHLRDIHKNVLFAFFYGATVPRIMSQLNITKNVAQKVYDKLSQNLPGLTAYQNKIRSHVRNTAIVRDHSYTSRIKYFYDYTVGN